MANQFFGWDLLFASVEKDIKKNQDLLVCLVHFTLISNGFKCIGLGDSKNVDGTETKSETLPKGWTENYAIRYLYQGRLYNLRATNMDDAVMFNLIRVDERTVSMVQLNTRSIVQRSGTLDDIIPDNAMMIESIKKQLIDKVIVSVKSKETSTQTSAETTQPPARPQLPGEDRPQPQFVPPTFDPFARPHNPLAVGRDDLDPFANFNPLRPGMPAGGGGMLFEPPRGPLFDPSSNLGIPGGSVPPGARFDPFRPPSVDRVPRRGNNPDNDDLPPPGFEDMFM